VHSLIHAIGSIFQPLLDLVGIVLVWLYALIPNYALDIALLTILIMALLTPLTVKSTKSMAAMQALGPEMKKLQQKYKGAENRAQLNEEMMRLYKEHNVNPATGCLPMLLQMPAFLILYDVIRGITNTVQLHGHTVAQPRYIGHHTALYGAIVAAHGRLMSFGLDFAEKLLQHHSSIWIAIPYLVLVLASIALQYLQMSRLNARNPQAAQANPQAAAMQKYMPLIFGLIYLNIAALINVYFVVSSAIRIITQEILFRKGLVPGSPAARSSAAAMVGTDKERALPKAGGSRRSSSGNGQKVGSETAGAEKQGDTTRTSNGARSGRKEDAAVANGKPASNGKRATAKPGAGAAPSRNGEKSADPALSTAKAQTSGKRSSAPAKDGGGGGGGRPNARQGNTKGSQAPSPQGSVGKAHPRAKAKRERKVR
jgi:YidC/Oxa1 family membrane protein insertase